MFKLLVLALFVICHAAFAVAHVCECAEAPNVPAHRWLATVAAFLTCALSVAVLVRHLACGDSTDDGDDPVGLA